MPRGIADGQTERHKGRIKDHEKNMINQKASANPGAFLMPERRHNMASKETIRLRLETKKKALEAADA